MLGHYVQHTFIPVNALINQAAILLYISIFVNSYFVLYFYQTTRVIKFEQKWRQNAYLNVNGGWHNDNGHQDVGHGKRADEIVGHVSETTFTIHTHHHKNIPKNRQHRKQH